jgi:hypothetical protein
MDNYEPPPWERQRVVTNRGAEPGFERWLEERESRHPSPPVDLPPPPPPVPRQAQAVLDAARATPRHVCPHCGSPAPFDTGAYQLGYAAGLAYSAGSLAAPQTKGGRG